MNDLFDDQPYGGIPPHQKHSETSKDAAVSVMNSVATIRARIYALIKATGGRTRDECEVELRLAMQTVSPRFCELAKMGLIEDGGIRRETRRGRKAVVWRVREAQAA
jgi:predicted ArsR family transcriptional regulator